MLGPTETAFPCIASLAGGNVCGQTEVVSKAIGGNATAILRRPGNDGTLMEDQTPPAFFKPPD
jgi:hypothetical protein